MKMLKPVKRYLDYQRIHRFSGREMTRILVAFVMLLLPQTGGANEKPEVSVQLGHFDWGNGVSFGTDTRHPISKQKKVQATMPMSIVNTTSNTFFTNGEWKSTMGALSSEHGGLACDNTVNDMRFHQGEYRHWFVAPSDSTRLLGMKKCSTTPQSEPSCIENWGLCGRKVRVKCLDAKYCGQPGEPSLIAQINDNHPPENNYLPAIFVKELTQILGKNPKVAKSVVLYITDFCPAEHSNNKMNNQCQGPQVDISTSAFLMMGKTNQQGYINTNIDVSVELLDMKDPTPVGPEY